MKVNPPARRTQAQRSAATRANLIAAARTLFAAHGFSEVSTESIVAEAGVTRGALYHQFADKTELFAAVYEQVEAGLVAAVLARSADPAPAGPLEAMRIGVRHFLDLCAAPDVAQVALIDAPSVLGWQRWRDIGARYGLGVIENLLTQAVADGSIPQQPIRATAHILLGALDEAALYAARADDPVTARNEMHAVCERIIAGLAAPLSPA
jgi:AcrR family transcriptional regulator